MNTLKISKSAQSKSEQSKSILSSKSLLTLCLSSALLLSGCSLFRSKKASDSDSQVKTETTANGGSESLDNSPINLSATGSDSGKIEGLNSVFFEYDRDALSSEEKEKLANNVAWIKKNSSAKITIEGHCDQRGSAEYNLALGERRANSVKKQLIAAGVKANRITTVSFGKEKPLANGESESDMAKNRRANFVPVE